MEKRYTVKGMKTAASEEEILETGYTLEEAKLAAIEYQRTLRYTAAWIEEEAGKPAPRPAEITRSVETDPRTRERYTVVRCNGWAI